MQRYIRDPSTKALPIVACDGIVNLYLSENWQVDLELRPRPGILEDFALYPCSSPIATDARKPRPVTHCSAIRRSVAVPWSWLRGWAVCTSGNAWEMLNSCNQSHSMDLHTTDSDWLNA
jgi:hypothetical protein